MAYCRGDNDRPKVLGHGFIEAATWGEGMSGDHNMHQKPRSYLDDFECPRCGHCCLQQTEQEPVAFINVEKQKLEWAKLTSWHTPTIVNLPKIPLYTAPPKQWVGLTDEEKEKLVETFYGTDIQRLEAVEAKLKEKNT
jgi:hypothetical protein